MYPTSHHSLILYTTVHHSVFVLFAVSHMSNMYSTKTCFEYELNKVLNFSFVFSQATSLITVMKSLSESIVHHIKYYVQLGCDDDKEKGSKQLKHTLPVHRLSVINLATFLLQFLENLVPLETVKSIVI